MNRMLRADSSGGWVMISIVLCVMLLIVNGCMLPRKVSAFQNGRNLGVWNVQMDQVFGQLRRRNGKRLIILPASGVDVGSVYFRRGGVIIAGRKPRR